MRERVTPDEPLGLPEPASADERSLLEPARAPRLAVVLAAGRSERLRALTGGGSKALVRLAGLSLVERAVRGLLAAGLERVLVVVGYHAGPVTAVVSRFAPGRVQAVFADGWELGNGASLAAAAPAVAHEELFVLVTADHVFGDSVLQPLVTSHQPAVLVDPAPPPEVWDEGTRVRIRDGMALSFSKELPDPAVDCGAFVLPPDVFEAQAVAATAGDHSLSGAVTELARRRPLAAVELPPGTWWHDVDTPQDFRVAKRRLRHALTKPEDGPISRYLNRPISTRLSMALAPLRLSPDLVSIVAALFGIVAGWLLSNSEAVAGAALVHATSVVDGVDGEVARLQLRQGPRGAMLDGVLDRAADVAIAGGMGVWALGSASARVVVWVVVAATAGSLLSMATKDRASALGLPPAPERWIGWLMGGRDGRLLILAVAGLLARPLTGLVLAAATAWASVLLRLFFVRRRVHSGR